MTPPTDTKWPLRTLTVAIRIIEALQSLDGAGVTELATQLDLAKSTVHNHLRTLEHHHYVIRDGDEYRLSLKFLDHGGYARHRDERFELIRQKVKYVAEETDELCQFVTEEHGTCVFVFRERGTQAVNTQTRTGSRVPLHHTTAGKAILASLPDERVEAIIERWGLPDKTEHTVSTPEDLFEELQTIRSQGYAFDKDEHIRGLNALGVAIEDETDAVLGAISVATPQHRLRSKSRENELSDFLLGIVNELELNIRYS